MEKAVQKSFSQRKYKQQSSEDLSDNDGKDEDEPLKLETPEVQVVSNEKFKVDLDAVISEDTTWIDKVFESNDVVVVSDSE